MSDICLISMPYGAIERPSIALGLLKACLQETGIDVSVVYPAIWFAEEIGVNVYKAIAENGDPADLLGEWTFSGMAFPDFHPNHHEYFDLALEGTCNEESYRRAYLPHDDIREVFWRVREQANSFIDRVAEVILEYHPHIVGCTSVFQQHCASLALLRRIRQLDPTVITMMGGANCEGQMGLVTHREFSWVDYVVSGEADELFAGFCQLLLDRGRDVQMEELPFGVLGPGHRTLLAFQPPRAITHKLDSIPIPSYDEYFECLEQSSIARYVTPGLLIETSRGCWWGQIRHCTFCGLNGGGMGYRSKSPDRVVHEFEALSRRYDKTNFEVVDNILDMSHVKTVMPKLAEHSKNYVIFYETKANLKREHLSQLAEAGVRWIQPGLESMHDDILKMLNKGNTVWMNVQLLKWALECGIRVSWNFLFGLPNESDEYYREMAEWLPLIVHLQPPSNIVRIRYDRFSPYHKSPTEYGIASLMPNRMYSYVYPVAQHAMNDLAYFFEDYTDSVREKFDPRLGRFARPGLDALREVVLEWDKLFWAKDPDSYPPVLNMVEAGARITLLDTRPCAKQVMMQLEGVAYHVYRFCDVATTFSALLSHLRKQLCSDLTADDVQPIVNELEQQLILVKLGDRLLSLATRVQSLPLLKLWEYPGGHLETDRARLKE